MADPAGGRDRSAEPGWIGDGLRFTCTGCGKCCTGASGSVDLSHADVERLARFLHSRVGVFLRTYTRMIHGRRVLVDRRHSSDCVFLNGRSCTVYEARPVQCRTYPWWFGNLHDAESWQEEAAVCEGIGHPNASFVSSAEILEQCWREAENASSPR